MIESIYRCGIPHRYEDPTAHPIHRERNQGLEPEITCLARPNQDVEPDPWDADVSHRPPGTRPQRGGPRDTAGTLHPPSGPILFLSWVSVQGQGECRENSLPPEAPGSQSKCRSHRRGATATLSQPGARERPWEGPQPGLISMSCTKPANRSPFFITCHGAERCQGRGDGPKSWHRAGSYK